MTKPLTQKETIDQTWYALYGTPGSPGLVERIAGLETKVTNGNGKNIRAWKIGGGVLGVMVTLQTLGLLDGIRATIFNWFAGGAS